MRTWTKVIEAVLDAPSLSSAHIAASDLIDAAVPGGSVVDREASQLISELAAIPNITRETYRGQILAVLLAMATWSHTWSRLFAAGDERNAAIAGAETEEDLSARLASLCRNLSTLLSDQDPEVRSVMCLLIGATGDPATEAAGTLQRQFELETHPKARACVVQGLIKAIARLHDIDRSAVVTWLHTNMGRFDDQALARIRLETKGNWRTSEENRHLRTVLGIDTKPLAEESVELWPVETI